MASRTALLITAAMAVVVVGALLPATESAVVYKVGDDTDGWDLDVDYNDWASGKTFKVGDTLEFAYSTEEEEEDTHNVVIVDEQHYTACTVPSNAPTMTSGDDRVTLDHAGKWFFICGVEDHCESGMKLAVNVN